MATRRPVALVLGAIKGIGRHIGTRFLEDGFRVAFIWFDWEEHLEDLERALSPHRGDVLVRRTDLTDCAAVPGLVEAVIRRFGRLDVLVNNIERGGWPVVHGAYLPEQWDLEMATTLRAKRWVFEAALPHLKASGAGCVVNLSSVAGLVGRSGPASLVFHDGYAAANRAVGSLTETWARVGAPEVRVNELMLGLFDTRHGPGTRGWGLLTREQRRALLDHTPLGRTGTPEDVWKAVRFLVRDAPFMTGAVLRLDGGYVLGGGVVAPMPRGVV